MIHYLLNTTALQSVLAHVVPPRKRSPGTEIHSLRPDKELSPENRMAQVPE